MFLNKLERVYNTIVPLLTLWCIHKYNKRITFLFSSIQKTTHTQPLQPLVSSIAVETENDESFLQVKEYEHDVGILKDMSAGDWCYDKTIVILSENMSMNQALERMHESHSTCALMYKENDNSLMGILDTRDIVRFILRSSSSMSCSAHKAIRRCIVASTSVTVNEICKHLCSGMRYIAVCSTMGGHQIVSQRAIVAAIMNAACSDDCLSQQLDVQIPEVCLKQLIVCTDTDSAKRAYELMAAYNITSLPIVNHNGFVCGVISATDILYARKDLSAVNQPVMTFVEKSRSDANIHRNANCIVSCRPNDSLITVLRLMMHEEVHHTYILDHDTPLGVVSFVDILQYLSFTND